MSEVKFWILVGTPALSNWWFTHLSRGGLNRETRPGFKFNYLSRIASGDIFIRLSSCSPPSNKLARPGHCSRLIWLNKPILRRVHDQSALFNQLFNQTGFKRSCCEEKYLIICHRRPRTRWGVPFIKSFASILTRLHLGTWIDSNGYMDTNWVHGYKLGTWIGANEN